MPEFFGQVELDLIQSRLIPDLERALDERTWQFIRIAVARLLDDETSWLWKAVNRERRRTHIPHSDGGRSSIREGRGRS